MRIKDFTDTIRHLTDPFNIPEARRMIQENPALTQEQFKAGGIVEPGVEYYGSFPPKVQSPPDNYPGTIEQWESLTKKQRYKLKNPDLFKNIGKGTGTTALDAAELWKSWTDTAPEFEKFVKSKMEKPTDDVKKIMNKHKLTADSNPQEFFTKMVDEYTEANRARKLTKAGTPTKSFVSRNVYENFLRNYKNVYKPQIGTISVKEFLDQVPAMQAYKDPWGEFSKMMNEAGSEDVLKRLDRGSVAFTSKLSKVKQGKEFMQALADAGIEIVDTRTKEYTAQRIRGGRPMGQAFRRIKLPTIEQITAFNDSGYFKEQYKLNPSYKDKISTLSIKDPQYKVGNYGTHRENLKQLQRVLNNKISSMTDAQLRAWVKNNPSLKKMVEFHFNPLNGEIEPIPLEKLTDYDLRRRVRIERDHIRGRSTVGYDAATNKILDGIDVEFPKNYQLQPNAINHVAKGNVERWVAKHPNETAKIQKLDDFFKSTGSSYWDAHANKVRGAPVKEISAYTDHLNIDMEQLLKSEEVFPPGHKDPISGKIREGERIVERPNLLAKIEKANLKALQDANIPCIKGAGGQCNSVADYRKGFNELVQRGAAGDEVAVSKLQKFTKTMKKLKGPLKWTGYGLLGEIGFMVPFAAADYTTGKSWKRIMGNASDWGFGPMFGQSEDEEIIANLPEGSLGAEAQVAQVAGQRLRALEDPNRNFPKGRIGMDPQRFQKAQAKVIPDAALDLRQKIDPFMEGPRNEYLNIELVDQAFKDWAATQELIKAQEAQRVQERRDRGFIAEEGWEKNFRRGRMGGGIMGLKK